MQSLLEGKREKAQIILKDHLASKRLNEILADWSKVLDGDSINRSSISHEPAREFGCRLIVKRYSKVRNKGLKLSKKTPSERFHAYRINIKRLRYLMEFLRPVIDNDDYTRLRTGLKSVQDAFGAFQDVDVQTEKIEQLALELHQVGESAQTLLAMGQLLGILDPLAGRRFHGPDISKLLSISSEINCIASAPVPGGGYDSATPGTGL
jgi:CHAD domain-containing protein